MVTALLVTIIAIAASFAVPDVYRSQVSVIPNTSAGGNAYSEIAAQFGGLAGIAGIDIGGGVQDQSDIGLEVLRSRKFVNDFIERRGILVPLMAAEDWQRSTDTLILDPDMYDAARDEWVREVSPPFLPKPSAQEAYLEFQERFSIETNGDVGFVFSFEHVSPFVAQQWLTWLVNDLNETVMSRDVAEAEQAIQYLNSELQKTAIAGLQDVLYRLIEEQLKVVMLSQVSSEYLFKTIDPAFVPELKHRPQRALIAALALVLGLVFAASVSLGYRLWGTSARSRSREHA